MSATSGGATGSEVVVEVRGPAAVVTLNRPSRRNAITPQMIDQLGTVMAELGNRGDVRAIVLTGSDPAFCAGLDLVAVSEGRFGRGPAPDQTTFATMLDCGKPLIGAINGPAITGGLEWALGCDFRIASERARFADTHARVGVMPGGGLTWRLPQVVGFGWARQMSFTGNFVDAALALRIGLVNEVVPHERLLPRALALAADMATVGPEDLAELRAMYRRSELGTAADAAAHEHEVLRRRSMDAAGVVARRDGVIDRGRGQVR